MPSAEHRYGSCTVSAQTNQYGTQDSRVLALTDQASPSRQPYIAVRVGRVLVYVHDYASLRSNVEAWNRAMELAPAVFGPEPDGFTRAAERERRDFERGHDPRPLSSVE